MKPGKPFSNQHTLFLAAREGGEEEEGEREGEREGGFPASPAQKRRENQYSMTFLMASKLRNLSGT